MKENKIRKGSKARTALAVVLLVITIGALIGIAFAYSTLRDIWLEQCVITDVASQVSITDGKMVRADVIAYEFGLKNGANLARIDFDAKRREVLKKIPNIRAITISRRLPNRVSIDVEERIPVVRLCFKNLKRDTGRVADTDGVVFISSSGTQMLPTIREAAAPGTAKGQKLSGHALAALRLIETCRDQFRELNVIDADASKSDYITIVLSDYTTAKVAWQGMDAPSKATQNNLNTQLRCLVQAISSRVDDSVSDWDATIPGKVYGNTRRNIQ